MLFASIWNKQKYGTECQKCDFFTGKKVYELQILGSQGLNSAVIFLSGSKPWGLKIVLSQNFLPEPKGTVCKLSFSNSPSICKYKKEWNHNPNT